ncbi:putative ATPase YjoB [Hypsizygus marmoreus]|uniref:ATPase YjoB n=1 Tax=Hypsizygus marmoreus TaxID=39966 RepID=A0A369JLD7_HYPMA|nr:putative ATPase YjoB [Hypsizygus marmoreus]
MEETFVNVFFDKEDSAKSNNVKGDFYGQWSDLASAKHSSPLLSGADALRRIYPNHSLVTTTDYRLNVLDHPAVLAAPLEKTPLVTNLVFFPFARAVGSIPGILADQIEFGAFKISWDKYEFLLFTVQYPQGFGTYTARYILHEGPEDPARLLLLAVGAWAVQLHDEIWVFNEGFWQKDHGLWNEIQKADWKDVILKDTFKKALQKDVYGFFASEEIYKELAIPWKRGLIMYGPPGNGKTISIKVIMKTCEDQGFTPLYVKSFQSWRGEEGAMADVFDHARKMAPCVVILEDLDSLINDRNRSFFLNQLDGLSGNNGLLIIGTTNHFERLDPGLSNRPSRFDRKFKFGDPDQEERVLYAKYWQHKLENNKAIAFPDQLVNDIAEVTAGFSFAYLKEAFVLSLVELAGFEGDEKPTFETMIKSTIKTLRKELDHSLTRSRFLPSPTRATITGNDSTAKRPGQSSDGRGIHNFLDSLSDTLRPNSLFPNRRYIQARPHDERSSRDPFQFSKNIPDYAPTVRGAEGSVGVARHSYADYPGYGADLN